MKITKVHIDQFSGWQDTTLDLPDEDLHVLYGPNETGKSTLLRFLRGVLYGYPDHDRFGTGIRERQAPCAGHVCVTHGGQHYVIRRESGSLHAGGVHLTDEHGRELPESVLAELLGDVSAETFENVFALGLPELQEVSTLAADEIASHVYHVSLGPSGRRLMDAHTEARRRRTLLLDEDKSDGLVVSLARRIGELDDQIEGCRQDALRHDALCLEIRHIETELQNQKQRQQGLQSQLTGHEFMERISGPWSRKRDIEDELQQLPRVARIPEGGIERLDELELEIENLRSRKRTLINQARRLAKSAAAFVSDSPLAEHAATVRALLQQRNRFAEEQSRLSELRRAHEQTRRQVAEAVSKLGDAWTEQRVESVDDSSAAAVRLLREGSRYRELLKRRAREVRRYQRIASRLQQQQTELAQQFKPFQAADAGEAQDACRRQLALLETISANELRAQALQQTRDELTAELETRETSRLLPPYFFSVLIAFGIVGLALFIFGLFGLVQGRTGHTPWLVGFIYMLLGAGCGGVTWTAKRRMDPDVQRDKSLNERLQLVTDQLSQLQDDISRNRQSVSITAIMPADPSRHSDDWETADAVEVARGRLVDAERLLREEQSVKTRRMSLSRFRDRIRETQRTASSARREWCLVLREIGLDESVRVDSPLEQWQAATLARGRLRHDQSVAAELESIARNTGEFRTTVVQLARSLESENVDTDDVAEVLDNWEQRLSARDDSRRERREMRQELRRQRRAAERMAEQISDRQRKRLEHFAAAGAADREDFQNRVHAFSRRHALEGELSISNDELTRAAQSEPELAIVEEDLNAFEPVANRAAIETIRRELSDLVDDLGANHENVGRMRQELKQLEADRRLSSLRYDRAQLRHQLVEELESLSAIGVASTALEHVRSQLELEHQPQTLQCASSFLSRLTGAAYRRVWTRIGERRLFVDEERNEALDVERLSAGTREQLFLAIRLALIDQLRRQGVELPFVLDDVLVNFDEHRTEAAVQTLCDVAASGQQILVFTCHDHLAQRFRSTGVSTVNLPSRPLPSMQRRVG